ncbi:hypothetical protein BDW_04920 [Bdellovibrio bacteriovorus W]|nr:hypothetical protein BDW_04920 [Bdellovibrio bacteriovorus W]
MFVLKCVIAFYVFAFALDLFSKNRGKSWLVLDLIKFLFRGLLKL